MNKNDEYAAVVAEVIMSLFVDEEHGGNPNYHYDLREIDVTEFMTSLVTGCNLVFSTITGENKNNLEFTYLLNQLVVQDFINIAKQEEKE